MSTRTVDKARNLMQVNIPSHEGEAEFLAKHAQDLENLLWDLCDEYENLCAKNDDLTARLQQAEEVAP